MPTNLSGPKALSRADRDAEVLRLRREDYTYRQIAEIVGMDPSNCARLVERHLADIPKEEAAALRQWEREKLNVMERDAQEQAYGFRAELGANGKPVWEAVCSDDGVVMQNEDGPPMMRIRRDYDANNQGRALLLKIHERRCKLFGLDAPVKTANTFENVGADTEITFRIVDAKNGRMVEYPAPAAPVEDIPNDLGASVVGSRVVNGVEVVTFSIPEPSELKYHG